MYNKYIKRILDIIGAVLALIMFLWLFVIIYLLVLIKLGKPVIFIQPRPGIKDGNGNEIIFDLYKFRTMTDKRDIEGNLLSNDQRITNLGNVLREHSLDELPQIINILKGDMSFVGPRPQLVKDMVFMSDNQRKRHNVKPGLTGYAQINGRNLITWEEKFNMDIYYVENMSFLFDAKIFFQTVAKVVKKEGVLTLDCDTTEDLGDALLKEGKITKAHYDEKQKEAIKLIHQ